MVNVAIWIQSKRAAMEVPADPQEFMPKSLVDSSITPEPVSVSTATPPQILSQPRNIIGFSQFNHKQVKLDKNTNMLQGSTDDLNMMGENDGGPQFAEVFVIYWLGASVVTINIKLLGGNISFFQSVCVLGYCVCPLGLALIICRVLLAVSADSLGLFIARFISVIAGFAWSTFASTAFLAESQPVGRKVLAMYPLFLFYFVISWLIISHTHS
ncbi:protein yipf [Plakobranchus ocellatus]|uniref:Protein YIPF n=1 Tax=Plakobranchus ocellatus TaxID=259542 RepID=A0AAV3ZUB7_9GAST|nr:protein yipf [Plakobranchus ocellatus]